MRLFCLCLCFVAILCAGCASVKGLEALKPAGPDLAYQETFEQWTKEARIYDGFETQLFICATFKSLPLRMAFVQEHARVYGLLPREKGKMEADQKAASQSSLDFVIAAYVPDDKYNDFSQTKSVWSIFLENGEGEREEPLEVRRLSEQDGAALKYFYPYFTPWKRAYLVRFPLRGPEAREDFLRPGIERLTLTVRGPMAVAELKWDRPKSGWGSPRAEKAAKTE